MIDKAIEDVPSSAFDCLVNKLGQTLALSSGLTSDDIFIEHLQQLMEAYKSEEKDWAKYAFSDYTRGYTRNLVDYSNGKSNVLVLVWTPGKGSPIHDHADAHCLMKVLKGSLKETLYAWPDHSLTSQGLKSPLAITKETTVLQDQVSYMSDSLGLHKISNPDSENVAVSLHLYTPPNAAKTGCYMYDEYTGESRHALQCQYYSEFGVKSSRCAQEFVKIS